ncbi:MAG: AmmeMemoRadiSam system protein B [Burkholderiales bacterium]
MQKIRPAACAGSFYPENRHELEASLDTLLADAAGEAASLPRAMIAPHAGYVYSGKVAARAYARLMGSGYRRVVLLGPAHRHRFLGIALPVASMFETPLGSIPLDPVCRELSSLPNFIGSDEAHRMEHAIEVQLPFLQRVLEKFSIVPLLVGNVSPVAVSEIIDRFIGEPGTLVLVSSDLSHFHSYDEARALDAATAESIMALDPVLNHEQACGATPVNALLLSARRHDLSPQLIDIRNSGDTHGSREKVVGYASFSFGSAP